jgi:hypothetical protein
LETNPVSEYSIHARIGDCSYNEVCWVDEESMAHEIARSMFGAGARVEYVREVA